MDLAFNNLRKLICYKTQTTNHNRCAKRAFLGNESMDKANEERVRKRERERVENRIGGNMGEKREEKEYVT